MTDALPFPDPTHRAPGSADADRDRENLFKHSLDLMCVAGFDGHFKQVNPAWTRALGWSEAELLSRRIIEFVHPDDRERTLAARADLARGIPLVAFENRYLCKDGGYRWLSWRSNAEPSAGTVFAVARDVTEQRHAAEVNQLTSKLEATGVLARGLGHDYNNLLAVAIMNLDLLQFHGGLNDDQTRYLSRAKGSLQSARRLTDQLISLTSGDQSPHEPLNLKHVLEEAFQETLRDSNLTPEIEIAPDLWPAPADRLQVFQLIQALACNGRDAMPAGGTLRLEAANVTLPPSTASRPDGPPPRRFLRIRVIDQGVGIPADVLPKVFDPYFSTKPRHTAKGMGMGLSVCHAIMQKHGGSITLHSAPGRGTTAECLFPADAPA